MILQKLKKDKNFHKWLVAHNENRIERYYIETILESYKTKRPLDEIQEFIAKKRPFMLEKDYKPLKTVFKGKTLERFFNYIKKQNVDIYNQKTNHSLFVGIFQLLATVMSLVNQRNITTNKRKSSRVLA